MVSHNASLYLWWLSWTLARLKGTHSTQKLLYYMTPKALLPIPNKYASQDFSLLLDTEFKFHSENWRKICSFSPPPRMRFTGKGPGHVHIVHPCLVLHHIFYCDQGWILPSTSLLPLPNSPYASSMTFYCRSPWGENGEPWQVPDCFLVARSCIS